MLASAVKGATRPSQSIVWTVDGTTALALTGATLSGTITDVEGVSRAIAGALTVTDGANGVFRWDYAGADVVSAGVFDVRFVAVFGIEPTPAKTINEQWVVYD